MERPNSFLGGLSVEAFLADYWQRKPLLCRGALPSYTPPVSAEELAGLALEPEVESRIVQKPNWTLSRGPFSEDLFSTIGDRDWTLLIQDLDQHIPEVANLLGLLDFLPKWRIDDVMASFAAPGGSVGPHFDQYDVFLLQVSGARRWQISEDFNREERADSELSVLKNFKPEQEWVLQPGDLLYLPPHVAHHGVAESPCVTYSLGCRAPSVGDLVRQFAALQLEQLDDSRRYQDPPPASGNPERPRRGQLSNSSISQAQKLLRESLSPSEDSVARAFCQLMTEPKALFARDAPDDLTEEELAVVLAHAQFQRRKGSRWLWAEVSEGYGLYIDGSEWLVSAIPPGSEPLLTLLCDRVSISREALTQLFGTPGNETLQELFTELVRRGEITEARELC